MDIQEIVAEKETENRHLEYVWKDVDCRRTVETLVGMANGEGGSVVIGIRTDEAGLPSRIGDVQFREEVVREIDEVSVERAQPSLEYRTESFEICRNRLLAFTVSPLRRLRSYLHEYVEKPVFPVRRRTELEYISGETLGRNLLI